MAKTKEDTAVPSVEGEVSTTTEKRAREEDTTTNSNNAAADTASEGKDVEIIYSVFLNLIIVVIFLSSMRSYNIAFDFILVTEPPSKVAKTEETDGENEAAPADQNSEEKETVETPKKDSNSTPAATPATAAPSVGSPAAETPAPNMDTPSSQAVSSSEPSLPSGLPPGLPGAAEVTGTVATDPSALVTSASDPSGAPKSRSRC